MSDKKRRRKVIVDTSFLINVFDESKGATHDVAYKYYRYFIDHSIDMLLSPIVVAEFHQGQAITDLLTTQNFMMIPYNLQDAVKTADMCFALGGNKRVGRDHSNPKYMDDLKLLGQAATVNADFLITADTNTLVRYLDRLKAGTYTETVAIDINEPFDSSLFDNGQTGLNI